MIAKILSANLAEVCPIDGVSIGRKDNKSTWRVDFKSYATAAQRDAALAVVASFDAGAAEEAARVEGSEKAKLADIDFRSIRAIRAYIASRSDATSDIHALEAEATDQRKKLRPYTALT